MAPGFTPEPRHPGQITRSVSGRCCTKPLRKRKRKRALARERERGTAVLTHTCIWDLAVCIRCYDRKLPCSSRNCRARWLVSAAGRGVPLGICTILVGAPVHLLEGQRVRVHFVVPPRTAPAPSRRGAARVQRINRGRPSQTFSRQPVAIQ